MRICPTASPSSLPQKISSASTSLLPGGAGDFGHQIFSGSFFLALCPNSVEKGPFGMSALFTTGCSFSSLCVLHTKVLAILMPTAVKPQSRTGQMLKKRAEQEKGWLLETEGEGTGKGEGIEKGKVEADL